MTKTYVKTTAEFEQVGPFDQAAKADLFYGNAENPVALKGYHGIYNMGTGSMAQVASDKYQIIQHNHVMKAVAQILSELNIEVAGLVSDTGNKVRADLTFMNQGVPIKDDAKGIQLGIRVLNSYDKTSSFRLELFGYRFVCQNGMAFGKTLGVRQVTFHTGEKKPYGLIKKITREFLKTAISSSTRLQQYVNNCIKDSIEWELMDKLIPQLIRSKKHQKAIRERLEEIKNPTRWDFYNAITNYLTHDEAIKDTVRNHLENVS
jgi:hypothetical protein